MYETVTVFTGGIVTAMFVGAMNSKALAPTIALALGLVMVYPDENKAWLLIGFYIPAVIMANFRD